MKYAVYLAAVSDLSRQHADPYRGVKPLGEHAVIHAANSLPGRESCWLGFWACRFLVRMEAGRQQHRPHTVCGADGNVGGVQHLLL